MPALQKDEVVKALIASLRRDLDAVEAAARAAHDAATHPEAKPENDKDTRGLEAGYLAGAQSARAAELQQHLAAVERAAPSAFSLVVVHEEPAANAQSRSKPSPTSTTLLLSRVGGGQKVVVDSTTIQVVTPQSPIGRAVAGKVAGDDVVVEMGPRVRHLSIVSVS